MERRPLKPLPYNPKKGKIYEMYQKQMGTLALRVKLNQLMQLYSCQANVKYKRNMSIIPRKVWIEWIKIFGFPENYEPQEEWLDEEGLK
jgi:hypothetical protein